MNPYIREAIELSRSFEEYPENTPFGAVVVLGGEVVGRGTSSVVTLHDPTAHAEVMAIRDATSRRGHHLLPGATLYVSGYPCPLCLMACYWSQITSVKYGALLEDSTAAGFEDSYFYDQLRLDPEERDIPVEQDGAESAKRGGEVLKLWKKNFDSRESG